MKTHKRDVLPQRHRGTEKVLRPYIEKGFSAPLNLCGIFAVFIIIFQIDTVAAQEASPALKETDCMTCHGYQTMMRYDEGGAVRSLYVDNKEFVKTLHGQKLKCQSCHEGYDTLPHGKDTAKVNCTKECHITINNVEEVFTHKEIEDILGQSVHGRMDGKGELKQNAELLPDCKGCHKYNYPSLRDASGQKPPRLIAKADAFKMCSGCHEKHEIQSSFNLPNAVTSYLETFHGKALLFGMKEAPDCLDCHAGGEKKAHLVEGKSKVGSAIHKDNKYKTCTKDGCHPKGGKNMGGFHPHAEHDKTRYPLEYYMLSFFRILTAGVMYLFLSVMFLELLRRLFPDFLLFRSKRDEE